MTNLGHRKNSFLVFIVTVNCYWLKVIRDGSKSFYFNTRSRYFDSFRKHLHLFNPWHAPSSSPLMSTFSSPPNFYLTLTNALPYIDFFWFPPKQQEEILNDCSYKVRVSLHLEKYAVQIVYNIDLGKKFFPLNTYLLSPHQSIRRLRVNEWRLCRDKNLRRKWRAHVGMN